MRAGLIGWAVGMACAVTLFFLVQRATAPVALAGISYRFATCVFDGDEFPSGDLDNGRLLRRTGVPLRIATTFYDRDYREVVRPGAPGRYGAVVRIEVAGATTWRFVTLYRTPQKILWDAITLPITASLPPELGVDAAVLRNQQRQIGATLQNRFVDDDGYLPPAVAVLLAGLAETSPLDPPAVRRTGAQARDDAWWEGLRTRLGLARSYARLVDLPAGYADDPTRRWPLIVYLHHANDTGDDLRLVRQDGLPAQIVRGRRVPAVVVSPQCPSGEAWSTFALARLFKEVQAHYRIDPDRMSLTGCSAGGDATWDYALAHPEQLAAIVPIAGDTDPSDAARLRHLPVWAFQGAKDDIVWPGQSIGMVAAIRQMGGPAHLTLFSDLGHNVWDRAYAMDGFYRWLLAQKRGVPEISVADGPP